MSNWHASCAPLRFPSSARDSPIERSQDVPLPCPPLPAGRESACAKALAPLPLRSPCDALRFRPLPPLPSQVEPFAPPFPSPVITRSAPDSRALTFLIFVWKKAKSLRLSLCFETQKRPKSGRFRKPTCTIMQRCREKLPESRFSHKVYNEKICEKFKNISI